MTKDDVRSMVDEYECQIGCVSYRFKATGVAAEKYADPALARYLVDVEVVATAGEDTGPVRLHLLVWITDTSDLRALLKDALYHCLAQQAIQAKPAPVRRSTQSAGWAVRRAAKSA